MIFTLTLDMVLSGVKTQTRRIKKLHEVMNSSMARVESKTAKRHQILYQAGRTYAVQPGRGQKAVAYIVLRGVREEAVADISEADAHAEGFDSREDFFTAWRAIHGAKADLQQRVWVLEFELLSLYNKTMAQDPTIGGRMGRIDPYPAVSPTPRLKSTPRPEGHEKDIDAALYGLKKEGTAKDTKDTKTREV